MARTKKTYEAPDMAGFLRRMSKALVRRAAEGDLETLSAIRQVQADMDAALIDAAQSAHAAGYSWTEIARELGISRQAARQRFARTECDHGHLAGDCAEGCRVA